MTPTTTIQPGAVSGTVRAPGSKSVTHRAYILAARSDAPVTVAQPLRAADPDATLACLHTLGARFVPEAQAVRFTPAAWHAPAEVLDCRNAGSALRLLTAQVAAHPFAVAFTGDDSLRQRPNGPLLDSLRQLGARVDGMDGRCPYRIQGPIRPGRAHVDGQSSQFASALMMVLPLLGGPSTLHVQHLRSAPYLHVTQEVLRAFAIDIATQHQGEPAAGPQAADLAFTIEGQQVPRCDVFEVPGDWSAAAFPLAAAAVTGGKVQVDGLRWDAQGDQAILDLLASFGARIHDGATVSGGALDSPGTVDVSSTPDLFPVLCAVAACARGTTTFTGGQALRHKESDRIAAMAQGLRAMGIEAEERSDGLVVHGGRPRGATVTCHSDHRIHMALAVLALAADGPTTLEDPGCVAVSYPGFHADLAALEVA